MASQWGASKTTTTSPPPTSHGCRGPQMERPVTELKDSVTPVRTLALSSETVATGAAPAHQEASIHQVVRIAVNPKFHFPVAYWSTHGGRHEETEDLPYRHH